MKLIKFDLAINGKNVRNLEDLRNNFTIEILDLYSSGALLKWLNSRSLTTEADRLNAISADHSDVDKLKAMIDIFEVNTAQEVCLNKLSENSAGNEIHKEKQMTTTNKTVQILRHPKCPATILAQNLGSADEEIRAAIASNPALNETQQMQLADDKSVSVLLALLDNTNLSASNKTRLDANLSIALEASLNAKNVEANTDAGEDDVDEEKTHITAFGIKIPCQHDSDTNEEGLSHPRLLRPLSNK